MSGPGEPVVTAVDVHISRVEWPAIVAGAVVAAGISVTLLAFGSAIGLSVASAAPTWRDSSPWLWLLSGLFLVFIALCSFGFGGYVGGRMRSRLTSGATSPEVEFRDGMHGILVWALAILVTAVLGVAVAAASSRAVVPASGAAVSIAGETLVASELDELFRSDAREFDPNAIAYRRAEAARILLKTSSHAGVSSDDRAYLATLVSRVTGVPSDEAAARTDRVIGEATAEIRNAREASVMQAFMIAAALFLGAAISWFSAREGGFDRDRNAAPVWNWSYRPYRPV